MKLASWNINSVRLRQALVLDRLQGLDLDVLCLQEIQIRLRNSFCKKRKRLCFH